MDPFSVVSTENYGKKSLVTGLLLVVAAHFVFRFIQSLIEYRRDSEFGLQHGCQPPPELVNRWPLGVDWLREVYRTNSEGRLLDWFVSVAKEYEPYNMVSQYFLFGPRAYHLMRPETIESVLSTDFKDYGFGPRREVFAPLLGNGIFTQEGAAWKHSRELLRKQFVRAQYRNLDNFQEHVDNLIAQIPFDDTVDLQPLFYSFTLDTTTDLLFGRSTYSLRAGIDQDAKNKVFAESFAIAQEGLSNRFRMAPFHNLYRPKRFREACANVHRYVENYIEENFAESNRGGDEDSHAFMDEVAKESATKEDLRDQLLNVLLAGRDTTACCLSWTFRLLVRNSLVMARLRKDISTIMGSSDHPSREQIKQIPYLACVIKESLRLYPPVPSNNRTAIRTTILPTGGGPTGNSPILVRKGEMVTYGQYVNSRLPSLFGENASEFHPERWENSKDVAWAYTPFSGGPRQCLGEDFALMEISYTIVRILQAFPVILVPDSDDGRERQRLSLVLSCEDGCKVRMGK